jgi:AraC-like DNA-binding protein
VDTFILYHSNRNMGELSRKELARKAANTTGKAELEYIHRRRTESLAERKFALAGGGRLT